MKQLPYGVQTDKKVHRPAEAWCREQWGPRWEVGGNREGTWTVFWTGNRMSTPNHYQWWFATEEQQLWFTLRWS